jgi:hypothetical protein
MYIIYGVFASQEYLTHIALFIKESQEKYIVPLLQRCYS